MARIDAPARAAGLLGALTLAVAAAAPTAQALEQYGNQIPHLQQVGGCDGLCHATGSADSQFYKDFDRAGFDWNAAMAGYDSDNDGFSNGWELQNPSGNWAAGTAQPGSNAFVSDPVAAGSRPPVPVASVPTAIVHEEAAGQNGSELLAVQNVGAVPFDYSIGSSDAWMTPDPGSGLALPPSMQDELLVLFVTDGLGPGPYLGDLTVTIAGIRADRIPTIPVDLTVPEPGALATASGALLGLALLAPRRSARRARRD